MRPLRPILIALALLVALDLVLRSPLFPVVPATFRFRTANTAGFEESVESQRRERGVRVAVLGDSVVQGWRVGAAQATPAVLDRLYADAGRDVHVHNFGLSKAEPVDIEHVAERVARARSADLAVVQFDYLAYSSASTVPVYPQLAGVAPKPKKTKSRVAPMDAAVSGAVNRVWRLAASRQYLGAMLLGDFPQYLLKHRLVDTEGHLSLSPQPVKLSAGEFNLPMTRRAWQVPELDAGDESVAAFRRGLEMLREAGVPVIVFAGPLNRGLANELHVYDAERYESNVRLVRSICASEGAVFVDLSAAVPSAEMIDSLHLLPPGHARLARRLESVIETQVAAAERERGVVK